ncbi:hypothetical protein BGY98DRAFT_1109276 [Russula aff. rugulosa BPL654]|nr:hypothetical protein BGY98DRAFT_1109276 [Russula aff. rugulosa BPL654]
MGCVVSSQSALEQPMSAASSIPKLFQPIRVGTANLQHRVVLAPMTRKRANDQHVPGALALEYYKQRTSVPGTLAIAEGTFIAPQAGGYKNIPGIWSDEQISGWLPIVDAVHKNGSFIYLQLWASGAQQNPNPIPLIINPLHRAHPSGSMCSCLHGSSERRLRAGLTGRIHAANGYLPDQFYRRTPITHRFVRRLVENRARFVLELRVVGIRFSPWSTFQGGDGMPDPLPTFAEVVKRIRVGYPDFAYIHSGAPKASNKLLRDIWGDGAYITIRFGRDSAIETREGGWPHLVRASLHLKRQ